jgi:NADH-quinone oxidoreductase subunit J
MTPNQTAFLVVGLAAALGATGVVAFGDKPVRSALSLVLNFFVLGILYFMLGAQLLGITQVMVYAGAIMVLFLFVIMVLQLQSQRSEKRTERRWPFAVTGGLGFAALLAAMYVSNDLAPVTNPVDAAFGRPQAVGTYLFTQFALPFEVASVLLLVGIVGSVLLAKRRL